MERRIVAGLGRSVASTAPLAQVEHSLTALSLVDAMPKQGDWAFL